MTEGGWYPNADHQSFVDRWRGSTMPHTNVLLLHSTESSDWPTYDRGAGPGQVAPNATYKPSTLEMRQHFPAWMSSRALVNLPGGVETNTLNVFQVEIIGTCDPHSAIKPFVPELTDAQLEPLAKLWAWLNANYAVPLTALPDSRWRPYPSSYGTNNGTRMSFTAWEDFTGLCGHQHAPENVHGDPGSFPAGRLLQLAQEAAQGGSGGSAKPRVSELRNDLISARKQTAAILADGLWPDRMTAVRDGLTSSIKSLGELL